MLAVNGWQLFAHPLFLDQFEKLIEAVERLKAKDPEGFKDTANAKLLSAIEKLVFKQIPEDPTRPEYRQGGSLGGRRKYWFRAKFGRQRFQLFFRYSSEAKIIVYAWVNDQNTLRAYGAKTDAYTVFKTMLDKGNPPDDWPSLLADASSKVAKSRLRAIGES
jgi:toxin YhaV